MKAYSLLFLITITVFTSCRNPEEVNPKASTNKEHNLCTLAVPSTVDTTTKANAPAGIAVGGCIIDDSLILSKDVKLPPGTVPPADDSLTIPQPPMIPVGAGVIIHGTNTNTGGPDPFPGTTNCIEQQINLFSHSPFICDGAKVTEVTFQEQSVFVFYPGNCAMDMAWSVSDSNCNYMGTLGGIANITQINGVDFNSNSVLVNTLWTK